MLKEFFFGLTRLFPNWHKEFQLEEVASVFNAPLHNAWQDVMKIRGTLQTAKK